MHGVGPADRHHHPRNTGGRETSEREASGHGRSEGVGRRTGVVTRASGNESEGEQSGRELGRQEDRLLER